MSTQIIHNRRECSISLYLAILFTLLQRKKQNRLPNLKKHAEQIHILRCAKIVVTLHTTATLKKRLWGLIIKDEESFITPKIVKRNEI